MERLLFALAARRRAAAAGPARVQAQAQVITTGAGGGVADVDLAAAKDEWTGMKWAAIIRLLEEQKARTRCPGLRVCG